jgi:hypothetical protein
MPVRHLDPVALKLWMVIYTKSIIPGLWTGDVQDLSSQSFLSAEDTLRGLDELRSRELIEFDRAHRVLRLTQLPDAGEWPAAPTILKSWWGHFNRKVQACPVRDSHVSVLRWLVDEGARQSSKNTSGRPSALHEQIWSETFASVGIPVPRRRGVQRFGESGLETVNQPSLFALLEPRPSQVVETETDSSTGVDKSGPREINTLSGSERVSRPSGEGEGAGEGVFLGRGGAEGEGIDKRPMLTLVPPPAYAPFTLEQLLDVLDTRGPKLYEHERDAISEAITASTDLVLGEDANEILKHVASSRIPAREAGRPGVLRAELERARARCAVARDRVAVMREAREKAGV